MQLWSVGMGKLLDFQGPCVGLPLCSHSFQPVPLMLSHPILESKKLERVAESAAQPSPAQPVPAPGLPAGST